MKKCSRCKKTKELSEFNQHKGRKDGLQHRCKTCLREYRLKNKSRLTEANKEYYQNNREKVLKQKKIYTSQNKEKRKIYLKKNKEMLDIQRNVYTEENKEKIAQKGKEYRKNNPDKITAIGAKRRATKKDATPEWYEKDKIEVLYEKARWLESLTGLKYHVDHIIPLQGKNVSGLHCWANLQILEASINIKKGNKF